MKLVAAVTSTQEKTSMSSIPKADNGTLTDLPANIQKLTKVEQVNVENEWTEFLSLCLGIVVDYKGGR
jgi:hypothetical protein